MPIQVTCSKCHTRFSVSEKFAGQTGPCPKCKAPIRVPTKSEEVVIHAPEQFGPKDAQGRAVLKPIEREETKITPVGIVAIVGSVVIVLVVTFLLGRMYRTDEGVEVPRTILGLGAVLLAPPLVLAAYSFLRDEELEPYRGVPLAIRVAICAVVYALLWGGYDYVTTMLMGDRSPEIWQLFFALPAMVGLGGVAPLASLDLDYGNACVHCGVYILACVLLRLLMGLPPL
jgi:hypothetical protein